MALLEIEAGTAGKPGEAGAPDALELELFRYAVESVVDELDLNITRTAHSPLVYLYKDFSVGVVTRDFRLLSQSKYNMPIFIADLGTPVQDAVEVIGEDRIEPGDVFITNYNPANGSHLNNVVSATPVYNADDTIAAYIAVRTHWPDVGGLIPGSVTWDSTHIFHEGVQYRGLKIVNAGELVPEVLATIQANSWMPRLVTGDVMANIAACTLGAARWEEQVSRRWSAREIDTLVAVQFAASARLARSKVAAIPDGEYSAEMEMDDSGAPGTPPLLLKVRVVVAGERMTIDLSGLPPQVPAPINSGTTGGAISSSRVAFKSLFAPERPADEGFFEPLEVVIPEGTVMSAVNGAPMSWWNQLPGTVVDLVFRALGERYPELVPAGHHGAMTMAKLTGADHDHGYWIANSGFHGGHGATSEADGFGPLMTLMHGDNPHVADEVTEGLYPLRILGRKLRQAGGAGLHRGGPGMEVVLETLAPTTLTTVLNRTRTPAWGIAGGEDGLPGEIHLQGPGARRWRRLGLVSNESIPPGTRIRVRTGGGGGWGRPPE